MNFNSALKKVFGLSEFDENVDDLEYYGADRNNYDNPYRKTPEQKKEDEKKRAAEQAAKEQAEEAKEPAYKRLELPKKEVVDTSDLASEADNVPEIIVNKVVDIINHNLSPLIMKHLDVEGQKRSLSNTLKPQFQELVERIRRDVLEKAELRWKEDRQDLILKLKETDEAAMKAHNEISELNAKLKNAESARKSALKRSNDMSTRVDNLISEKTTFEQEIRKLNNQLTTLRNNPPKDPEAAKLKEEIAEKDKQISEYYEKNQRIQRELSETKNSLKEAIAGNVTADVKEQLADKDEEIEQLAAQVAWLHRQIDTVKDELETAQAGEGRQAEADDALRKKDSEIAVLKNTVAQLKQSQNEKNSKLEAQKREIEQLKAQKSDKDPGAEAEKQIDDLKEQLLNANAINSDLADQIDELKEQLKKAGEKADESKPASLADGLDTLDISDEGQLSLF